MNQVSGESQRLQRLAWWASCFLISLVVAVPMVAVLTSLVLSGDTEWGHIRTVLLPEYLNNTFWLMVQVGTYSLLLGVGTAWLTASCVFPGHRWLRWGLTLPLAMPAYVMAYVYTDLLDFSGPVQNALRSALGLEFDVAVLPEIRSLTGAAFVMSLSLFPYVYLLARVGFLQRSTKLFNAARTLGASPFRAFAKIALPASRASIAGGLTLVLMETLADFGVVEYFGVPTFSTGIFRTWFANGDKLAAMKLAAVMFVFVIVLVVAEKLNRRTAYRSELEMEGSASPIHLRGWQAMVATCFCAIPVLLGSAIPIASLLQMAIESGDPLLGGAFAGFAANSVAVSLGAALLTVGVALILTYGQRLSRHWSTDGTIHIATLGYALPGTMLAVGLIPPVSSLDQSLAGFFEDQLGWRTGLILSGTVFLLVYAYLCRFLTVAHNTTHSAASAIPPVYEQAARTLGASSKRVAFAIHFPLIRRAIMTATLLVFVDGMRELPATLLLRPFNFETLATRVYRLAADERLAEASSAALAIVAIGLIPVFLLNRQKTAE